MNWQKLKTNPWVRYGGILLLGLLLGYLFFGGGEKEVDPAEHNHATEGTTWTCSMHPQIRQDKPGQCPICGMDLIPLAKDGGAMSDDIVLSLDAVKLSGIQTSPVARGNLGQSIRLTGKVVADERKLTSQTAHFPGRIERLLVSFEGEQVRAGQVVAEMYSPELVAAQRELLETAKYKDSQPALYEAARRKLLRWKLSETQINRIVERGEVSERLPVHADVSGVVTSRQVARMDHVTEGQVLFEIADLSTVWVEFDAYEQDLSALRVGQPIRFSVAGVQSDSFAANIQYIDPVLDPLTRTANVRVTLANRGGKLRPGMFATGVVQARPVSQDDGLLVPRSAVLWTGTRSVVYVEVENQPEPTYRLREIDLGPVVGAFYRVDNGLSEGERVVSNGAFTVDAAAQLQQKPSMMNPESTAPTTSLPTPAQISGKAPANLSDILLAYDAVKEALIASDASRAAAAAEKLMATVHKAPSGTIPSSWHKLIGQISGSKDLAAQREAFAQLSVDLIALVQKHGSKNTLYVAHCPMAFDDRGADWLSRTAQISNPYYGEAMLRCGEVLDTLKP